MNGHLLTDAIIPEGVTSIRDKAFAGCSSLTSITIPEGVTSIGSEAFSGCSGLTSITIPEGVTSIGSEAFSGCSGLTSITIPESLTSIGNSAFYECSALKKVDIVDLKSWLHLQLGNYLSNPLCYNDGDGELYNGNKELYLNGHLLTDAIIPEGVTSIRDKAFQNCSSLASITFPDGVTSIGSYAFAGCSGLTSINIPEDVTTIGSCAFFNCSSLTSINIPESVTSIGSAAFYGCSGLNYIVFEGSTPCSQSGFDSNTVVLIVPDDDAEAYKAAWPNYQNQIVRAGYWEKEIEVTENKSASSVANTLGEANLMDVARLKIIGTINSYDFMIFRNKMVNLRELDLSDVTIVANGYEYYSGSHTTDNVLGANSFRETKIRSIVLPKNVKSIGSYAFYSCSNLRDITFSDSLTSIGSYAFQSCSGLTSITLPDSLTSIGSYAFQYCSGLTSITLPDSLTSIGEGAFSSCSRLTSITLPEGVTTIPYYAFGYCYSLQEVKLSPKTEYINGYAFKYCSQLSEIHLPSYLKLIYDYAFQYCSNLKKIYAYMPDIISIGQNTFPNYQTAELYVPAFLYNSYYYDTQWSQFLSVNRCELKAGDYEAFYTNGDIVFEEGVERITEDTPEAEVGNQGGIIVEGEEQAFESIDQNSNGEGQSASLIGDGDTEDTNNMPVNELRVKIQVRANRWYFFCFPFDVVISECKYPGRYVWREYDGQTRAHNGSGGWKSVSGTTLTGRKGYIFQSSAAGTLVVKFQKPTFGGERPKELAAYTSTNNAHASWNFVGNPYSCYYDFQCEDFTAPITVWNGSSYQAYRPGDDDFHLQPYQAFFVQKPTSTDRIGFTPEHRETYRQSQRKQAAQAKARRMKGIDPQRRLINLTISDNDTAAIDRTRLVLNEEASRDYELECDAAKFLSNDAAAQLYMVETGVCMAIDERPSDGDIRLGYVAKQAGTLRIEAPRMDLPMMLVDTKTNTTFDLSIGSYEFTTEAGTFDQRFLLRLSGEATAIQNLTAQTGVAIGTQDGGLSIGGAEGKSVSIYTMNGTQAAQQTGNGFVSLSSGVYVVKVDGVSAKVFVK